jgi:glutathione S-transferase
MSHIGSIVRHRFTLPEPERVQAVADDARLRLRDVLEMLDGQLRERRFIAGDDFTAADIMVGYGVALSKIMRELPPEMSGLSEYLSRLKERPAYGRAWA